MSKKKTNKKKPREMKPADDDAITPEKLIGFFTAAYVLDVAGTLDVAKKKKLDSLIYPGCPTWDKAVEDSYGITKTFVRSIYAICTEIIEPPDAVLFILRGLGCPEYQERLNEILGLSE